MTILLTILKVVGIVLLCIIALLVLFILAVLICPIAYEASGEKYDKITIEGKIKLFLGIVAFKFKNVVDGETYANLYVFGKKLGNKKEKKKSVKTKQHEDRTESEGSLVAAELNTESGIEKDIEVDNKNSEKIDNEKEQKIETNACDDIWDDKTDDNIGPIVRKVKLNDSKIVLHESKDITSTQVKKIDNENEKGKKQESETKEEKRQNKKHNEKDDRTEINLQYFLKMPKDERKVLINAIIKLLKSLFKGVKPKDFYLIGTVGFDDPTITGEVIGAAWTLNGILNKKIQINGDFEREIVEGKIYIKGRIIPAYMLFCVVRFALVKPVRKIIKILLKGSGDKNGKRNR